MFNCSEDARNRLTTTSNELGSPVIPTSLEVPRPERNWGSLFIVVLVHCWVDYYNDCHQFNLLKSGNLLISRSDLNHPMV